jgi:AraC-like DNA-binding protein
MSAGGFAVPVGMRALLSDLGVAPANVLRRASLPADLLARPSVTLTPEKYFAFFEAIEAEADEPNLPIAIGRAISVEVFDPPIFAALCSPNLIVAAERIAQYKQLIGPLRLNVTQGPAGTTLTLAWPVLHDPPQVLAISELVFWVALGRIATRTDVRPVRVTTASPPLDTRAYEHYLGVAITEAAEESITFSVMDARRPFLTADERTWAFFEPDLRRRLSELDDGASTAERARATLIELLPAGRATMPAVAGELAISTRTLQRRLQEENTSFQAVLAQTREALARHYLASGRLTAGEISFLLGYSDPNSFYRAFHVWTGQTAQHSRTLGRLSSA